MGERLIEGLEKKGYHSIQSALCALHSTFRVALLRQSAVESKIEIVCSHRVDLQNAIVVAVGRLVHRDGSWYLVNNREGEPSLEQALKHMLDVSGCEETLGTKDTQAHMM